MNAETKTQEKALKGIPAAVPPQQIRRFSVKEYHWMGEVGILPPDEHTELIDGVIKEMSPRGTRHAACVRRLTNLLPHVLQARAQVSVQDPIVLDDSTEPEPDVALVVPREDAYATAHPRPEMFCWSSKLQTPP